MCVGCGQRHFIAKSKREPLKIWRIPSPVQETPPHLYTEGQQGIEQDAEMQEIERAQPGLPVGWEVNSGMKAKPQTAH